MPEATVSLLALCLLAMFSQSRVTVKRETWQPGAMASHYLPETIGFLFLGHTHMNLFFFILLYFYFMCMGILPVCVWTTCVPGGC